jgi:hypothetical protein
MHTHSKATFLRDLQAAIPPHHILHIGKTQTQTQDKNAFNPNFEYENALKSFPTYNFAQAIDTQKQIVRPICDWNLNFNHHPYSKEVVGSDTVLLIGDYVYAHTKDVGNTGRMKQIISTLENTQFSFSVAKIGQRFEFESIDKYEANLPPNFKQEGDDLISKREFLNCVFEAYTKNHTSIRELIPNTNYLFSIYSPLSPHKMILITQDKAHIFASDKRSNQYINCEGILYGLQNQLSANALREYFTQAKLKAQNQRNKIKFSQSINRSERAHNPYSNTPLHLQLYDTYTNGKPETEVEFQIPILEPYIAKTEIGNLRYDPVTISTMLSLKPNSWILLNYPKVHAGYEHTFVFSHGGICYNGESRFQEIGITVENHYNYSRNNALKLAQVLNQGPFNLFHGYEQNAQNIINPVRSPTLLKHRLVNS